MSNKAPVDIPAHTIHYQAISLCNVERPETYSQGVKACETLENDPISQLISYTQAGGIFTLLWPTLLYEV